ncbi:Arm DNA-binding domain-containing protein [Paraburkholderia phenoliruptrix]
MPLTDAAERAARPREKASKLADSQGIHLEVMPNGSKCWRLKCGIDGRERRAVLGGYPKGCSLPPVRRVRK